MTPSYTPVIPKLCMYLINAELTIVSSLKHKNTQPIYIFKRENPQNSEPQNGPRRGLDYIALAIYTTQLVSFRSAQCILSILALHSRGGLELNFQASHVKLTQNLCIIGRNTPKKTFLELQGRGLQLHPEQIILDLSRARGVFECSVHIYRGP